jgi:hypothetical protein
MTQVTPGGSAPDEARARRPACYPETSTRPEPAHPGGRRRTLCRFRRLLHVTGFRFLRARLALAAIPVWLAVLGSAGAAELSPVQRLDHYPGALERRIEEKISLGDPDVLDWQEHVNRQFGQAVRPAMASPGHPLIPQIRAMLAALPDPIHRLASRYVTTVYLLENDYGTGTTEAVQDAEGRWRYGYIALNLSVLNRTANDWATWKERSAFRPDSLASLALAIEPRETDTVQGALRFIFLHELGHVLGLALGAHGFWDAEPIPAETRDSPFVRLSWTQGPEGKLVSRWREALPVLSRLDFYSFDEARLTTRDAWEAYAALAQTDFPSLYGATNLYDDFAEAFAIYVHTRLLRRPYEVEVTGRDGRRLTYRSCIQDGRCPRKLELLEQWLARGAG